MIRLTAATLSKCLGQVVPGNCVLCGRLTQASGRLCQHCQADLRLIEYYCQVCGVPLPAWLPDGQVCGACAGAKRPFRQCRSLFHYQTPVDQLITSFKFHGRFAAGHCLALLLAQAMQQHYCGLAYPETLVPVPLHRSRLQQRGYNQALELARVIGKKCRISVSNGDVLRCRNTPPQTKLSASARRANVRNVFSVSAANSFKGVTFVAIIDDVMTTMSTASAVAQLLISHGVKTVDIWTLARVSQQATLEKIEINSAIL